VKFLKRPVEVNAVQFDGNIRSLDIFSLREVGGFKISHNDEGKICLNIPTLEGEMTAQVGDWIIRGIQGEYYPCKPDIFEATYEPA
jgi:hypothetical protein